jgi:hypothetical protein
MVGQNKIQSRSNRCNRKSEQNTEYKKVRSSTDTLTPTLSKRCFNRLAPLVKSAGSLAQNKHAEALEIAIGESDLTKNSFTARQTKKATHN